MTSYSTTITRGAERDQPELPRVYFNEAYDLSGTAPTGSTVIYNAGDDLGQTIYNNPDSTIIIPSGITVQRMHTIKKPPSHGWTWVIKQGTLPTSGVLPTRAAFDALGAPVFRRALDANIGPPVFQFSVTPGEIPYKIRFVGLTVDTQSGDKPSLSSYAVIMPSQVQSGGGFSEPLLSREIVFDRLMMDLHPSSWSRDGFALNGHRLALIDVNILEAHYNDRGNAGESNQDSQAAYIGWGSVFEFNNVNMEGAHESFACTSLSGDGRLMPRDVRWRKVRLGKPLAWRGGTGDGKHSAKELGEWKSILRMEVDGLVLDNCWVDAQNGWALGFWSAYVGSYSPCDDVTIKNVLCRNCAGLIFVAPTYSSSAYGLIPARRIKLDNVLCVNLGGPITYNPDSGSGNNRMLQLPQAFAGNPYYTQNHTLLSRITALPRVVAGSNPLIQAETGSNPIKHVVIEDSIFGIPGPFADLYFGGTSGSTAQQRWDSTMIGASAFRRNVVLDPGDSARRINDGTNGNSYVVGGETNIGFVDHTVFDSQTANLATCVASGALANTSPYKGTGPGGADPGCDTSALNTAILGLVP